MLINLLPDFFAVHNSTDRVAAYLRYFETHRRLLEAYWHKGRRASLRELMINEGLPTIASRALSPGHAAWEYYGYTRREYASVRELEPVMSRALNNDLDRAGLGLRLRYLSGGMSDDARTVDRHVFPERSGYFVGTKMVEPAVNARGLPWTIRASAGEVTSIATTAAAST